MIMQVSKKILMQVKLGRKLYLVNNISNRVNIVNAPVNAARPDPFNNTNNFNTASPFVNAVSPNFGIARKSSFVDLSKYPDDPDMPELEDIVYSDDKEDVAPQTKSMTRMVKEQGGLHQINDEDFHTCVFACFLFQEEPKKVHQALKDPSWIEAMQEKLLQFKLQKWEQPSLAVGTYTASGNSLLAVRMPCAFYSQHAAYLQTQLLIAQKEEAGIQLQAEEFDFMAAAGDLEEIEEVNANCILMANLQQASTSGTQHDRAPVYDTDGSVEVHLNDNCYNNEIFNMFTQEEQYTDLLKPIPEPQLVPQNDNHVTSVAPIETYSAPNEEICAHQETVYRNLVDQVAQVNRVNSNMRATNAELKKVIYFLPYKEKKKLKHDFKIREDKFLDKEVDLEAKIKDLENIPLKRDQTVQTMHMINPKPDSFYHPNQKMALGYPNPSYLKKAQQKQQSLYNGNLLLKEHDPPVVYDSEETLELAQESHEKMRLLKKEIKPANYAKINYLSRAFVPQTTKSKEELFLSNVSNMVTASKTISIPNEDLSDDTTPSVVQKFLNEVKSSLVTLQRVVKQKNDFGSSQLVIFCHKEVHRIISYEISPIINQVDARVKNFEIQFLQEAAKFVQDFKFLAKEADESLDNQKSLELEIK
nr:putative ribonuclease H-like domain-containing protein [Tanacetum cinerariifolium]